MTISEWIKQERYRRGMNQQEMAMMTGLSKITIWNLENGKSCSPRTIKAILLAFGLDRIPDSIANN
jgi:transcriptional regulator with XRE-family HTH domain